MDELLSAYLDGELSSQERRQLEARLAVDPQLRERLEDLRHTVTLVRELPPVSAPRNFLLSPEMVGETRRSAPSSRRTSFLGNWLAPGLAFASGLSGLLFLVVLIGGMLGLQNPWLARPTPPAPDQVAMVEQPEEPAEESTTAQPMFLEAGTPESAGELSLEDQAVTGTETAEEIEEPALAAGEAISETAESPAMSPNGDVGGGEAPPAPTPAVLPTTVGEPRVAITSTLPSTVLRGEGAEGTPVAELVPHEPEDVQEDQVPETMLTVPPEPRPLGGFGPLAAAFAMLAFTLALAARLVWRASRR